MSVVLTVGRRSAARLVPVLQKSRRQRQCPLIKVSVSEQTTATATAAGLSTSTTLRFSSRKRRERQRCDDDRAHSLWEWDSLMKPGACVLLVTWLCSSATSPRAEAAGWWPPSFFGGRKKSIFDDPRLRKAKKQRADADARIKAYMESMRDPVQELMAEAESGKITETELQKRMKAMSDEVELTTQQIVYGVSEPPDARRRYEAEYGCCRHTPEAITAIAGLSPLVELGAGRGHWQRALTAAGATVIAYDHAAHQFSPSGKAPMVGDVLPGVPGAIRLHQDKTLLLVYPPPGDMALQCLEKYQGEHFVYVGEGRGGVTGCDAFFDKLDAEWEAVTIMNLDPFPQCFERLFVLRRKKNETVVKDANVEVAASVGGTVNVEECPKQSR